MDEPRLGVAAAARRLGIAPATLRTWDRRYGIGPSEHAPGRHRRYSPDDIVRLELMQRALMRGASPADAARYARTAPLPAAAPGADGSSTTDGDGIVLDPGDSLGARSTNGRSGVDGRGGHDGDGDAGLDAEPGDEPRVRVGGRVLRLPGAGRGARGLGRAALALDAGAVHALLAESIAASGVVRTWDEVARPVLAAVAERWAYTGAGVEIEHLLSECVLSVFGARVTDGAPTGDVRPVLLAGMPGEHHTLPIVVLAAALADQGVVCRPLGPNLPVAALVASIRRTAPAGVVLWSQLSPSADVEVLRSLPRTRLRFRAYAAGPGWAGVELPARVEWLDSLASATATITAAVLV